MIEGLLAAILAELIYIAIKLSSIQDDLDEIVSVLNGEGVEIIDDPD